MEQLSDILKSLQESNLLDGSEFSNLSMDELGFENAISLMEMATMDNEFDLVGSILSIDLKQAIDVYNVVSKNGANEGSVSKLNFLLTKYGLENVEYSTEAAGNLLDKISKGIQTVIAKIVGFFDEMLKSYVSGSSFAMRALKKVKSEIDFNKPVKGTYKDVALFATGMYVDRFDEHIKGASEILGVNESEVKNSYSEAIIKSVAEGGEDTAAATLGSLVLALAKGKDANDFRESIPSDADLVKNTAVIAGNRRIVFYRTNGSVWNVKSVRIKPGGKEVESQEVDLAELDLKRLEKAIGTVENTTNRIIKDIRSVRNLLVNVKFDFKTAASEKGTQGEIMSYVNNISKILRGYGQASFNINTYLVKAVYRLTKEIADKQKAG